MRWIALPLLLAACTSTWTSYESGNSLRPELAAALRNHAGRAGLVANGRAYVIPREAPAVDVLGFTSALAEAVETQRYVDSGDGSDVIVMPDPDFKAVVSYAYPDRRLQLTGAVTVQGARRGSGYVYWVSVEKREREYHFVDVKATPKIDRAWGKLVRSAQAASRPAAHPPTPLTMMHDYDLIEVAVDIAGDG